MKIKSCLLLVFFDQFAKFCALHFFPERVEINFGWMGASFADLDLIIRVGILTGYYACVAIMIASFYRALLDLPAMLRTSALLFFAGITGNFIDRLRMDGAIDFIPFPIGGQTLLLNFADLFQWCALGLFLFYLVTNRKTKIIIEKRNRIFVYRRLQLRLFAKLSLVFCGFIGCMNIVLFLATQHAHALGPANLFKPVLLVSLVYGCLFEVVLFLILLTETSRWLGPWKSFIAYSLRDSQGKAFQLRSKDEFKVLEEIARRHREDT